MSSHCNDSFTIACISVAGGPALQSCIDSILRTGLGCIVIADGRTIAGEVSKLVNEHKLYLIRTDSCSVPEKRAIAVSAAKTEWIALVEDTCAVSDTWRSGCEEIMACKKAHAGSGPVFLGRSLSAPARALYCSDYSNFLASVSEQKTGNLKTEMLQSDTLPGVNLLYRCDTVKRYITNEGLIESEVNRRMSKDGYKLYIHKDLTVILLHADDNSLKLRSRFLHGRLYGGLRAREMTIGQRILRIMSCVLLPAILSYRSLRSLARDRRKIAATALYIVAFETAWSCGEFTGYLLGCGKSLEHWK